MFPIYIFEQNSVVKFSEGEIILENESVQKKYPINTVSHLVVFGNITITTPVIKEFLKTDRDIFFLGENGDYIGEINSITGKNTNLKIEQYKKFLNEDFKLDFSKLIVLGKIANSRRNLQLLQRNKGVNLQYILDEIEKIKNNVNFAKSPEELLGIEGLASRKYFEGFGKLFENEVFSFSGRNKFPPKDEVNSMLSFGYTLLAQLVGGAIRQVGLDPFLGFFHKIDFGRKSLVYDMMEEFRYSIDGMVLGLVSRSIVLPEQFRKESDGRILMNREAIKSLIRAFHTKFAQKYDYPGQEKQVSFYDIIIKQQRNLRDLIYEKVNTYTPFKF